MASTNALYREVERDVAAVPGVLGIAASSVPLFTGSTSGANVRVEGFRRDPDTDANTRTNEVGPGFFATLGIPLLGGREFTAADRIGAPKVAIINQAFAAKFGLGANPVGKRMAFDGAGLGQVLDMEIVGLSQDAHYSGVKEHVPALVYTPALQDSALIGTFFYVRTSLEPNALLHTIRGVVARIDPNLPLIALKTMPQQIRENVALDRMIGMMSAAFAVLATLLAAVGLYGVLAYTVAQRTREIGVRIALGADASRVRGMVLGQVARLTLVGGVTGIVAALALGRAAESLLFGLDGHDPVVIIAAVSILAIVALGAGYIPAWRASRVDPMRALRYE
jgi:predicted permease